MKRKDVYIVSVDMLTSIGLDLETNWRSICDGISGIKQVDRFETEFIPTKIAATVDWFPDLNCRQRGEEMAYRVGSTALARASLPREAWAEMGLYCALGMPVMNWSPLLRHMRLTHTEEKARTVSAVIEKNECAAVSARELAGMFGTSSLPVLVNTACASGATAIQLALESVRAGEEGLALIIGSDSSVHEEVMIRFSLLSAMSTANARPTQAMKPFSKGRDGFVLGEGAAAMVIASEDAVRRWHLTPIARLSGAGDATDNFHRTRSAPDGKAIIASMARALADAGLDPAEINYVNAHGTSTVENDKMESFGIREVFGTHASRLWVTANKSMVGHTVIAAGIVEAVFSVLSILEKTIPPTINYEEPDETLGVRVVCGAPIRVPVRHVLSNSFGFGGQNVSLILSAV
jgi:3-oxoacyl-[acyl-carrier-protein] synthase II